MGWPGAVTCCKPAAVARAQQPQAWPSSHQAGGTWPATHPFLEHIGQRQQLKQHEQQCRASHSDVGVVALRSLHSLGQAVLLWNGEDRQQGQGCTGGAVGLAEQALHLQPDSCYRLPAPTISSNAPACGRS